MTKKIVAVGGGENGRLKSDGTRTMYPYELEKIDINTIKLTNKGIDLANIVWEEFV